jgi:hypothetical protein
VINENKFAPAVQPHLDLPFNEAGDVGLVLENREQVENIVVQPVPVAADLLYGGP